MFAVFVASESGASGFSGRPVGADVRARLSRFEKLRREDVRHWQLKRGSALHGARGPLARLRGLIEEAAQRFRRQEAGVAGRARCGDGFRRWRFCIKLRREIIRRRRHRGSSALHETRDPLVSLCNLVKEAAQLWSQEARAAHRARGGGHSGPSLVRSLSRSRSRSSISARSLRAVSCSRR